MSLARKGLRVFATNWGVFLVRFVAGVVIVRLLGAEGRGTVVILTLGVGLLATVGQFGLPNAAAFLLGKERFGFASLLAAFLVWTVLFSAVVAAGVFAARDFVWRTFFEGVALSPDLLLLTGLWLPATMAGNFVGYLHLSAGRTAAYAWQTLGVGLTGAGSTIVVVTFFGGGVTGAIWCAVLAQVLIAGAATVAGLRRGSWRAPGIWAQLLPLGAQNFAGTVGALVFKRLDNFILAYFWGPAAVGYYSVGSMANESLLSIPRSIGGLLTGKASSQDGAAAAVSVARATQAVFWILLACALGLIAGAPWVVPFIYGADFTAAVVPVQILAVSAVCLGTTIALNPYFIGVGRALLTSTLLLAGGAVATAAAFAWVPAHGPTGSAWAALAGSAVLLLLTVRAFGRLSGVGAGALFGWPRAEFARIRDRVRQKLSLSRP